MSNYGERYEYQEDEDQQPSLLEELTKNNEVIVEQEYESSQSEDSASEGEEPLDSDVS